ncbi:glycosyltransferase family 2 protein [Cytobacillus sp. Hz8]|uniref:glycosyltransferase family 2 protein n=1 Tax=Cytobacillus sp. Hz8 TaxID=3347168 RepID=UPI0035D8A13D
MFNFKRFTRKKISKNENQIEFKYNKEGFYIHKGPTGENDLTPLVSVITPVYNAESNLHKTIDSVRQQTIGFENVEYILVDDGSTDASRSILLDYANHFSNIKVVFLKENTGTPAAPRNLGIQLSQANYMTFLDADDWLAEDGLRVLYEILEETGDDYAVGRTIEVKNNSKKIVGEHESCKERRNVSPFSIPHIFQHLGPRSRMMKSAIIKDNQLTFPEMKFAEDKQFFIDVLIHCETISTTCNVIYYLNRLSDNNQSLTKQTNIMEKTDSNIKVIQYVKSKNLEVEKEKVILNRLYEFDSIRRLFNTNHFHKTVLKDLYLQKFKEILKTTEDLRYEFSDNFFEPINKAAYELIKKGQANKIAELYQWNKNEKIKDFVIKDQLPYMITPVLEGEHRLIRMPMLAVYKKGYFSNHDYNLEFQAYGDHIDNFTDVLIRDREEVTREYSLPVQVDKNGYGKFAVSVDLLNQFPTSNYIVFLRYNDYRKINIRKLNENQLHYDNRNFSFYTTAHSNIGFKIH